jgi:PiT family inorganic phosphate transporter
MSPFSLLIALFVLALLFDFLNGFHDGANVFSTIIASRAMSARGALALTGLANLAGPFLLGVAVAQTIGTEVVRPQAITIAVLLAALASACLWGFVTWVCGIPVSSSHALVGGLLGATVIEAGPEAIQSAGTCSRLRWCCRTCPQCSIAARSIDTYRTCRIARTLPPACLAWW